MNDLSSLCEVVSVCNEEERGGGQLLEPQHREESGFILSSSATTVLRGSVIRGKTVPGSRKQKEDGKLLRECGVALYFSPFGKTTLPPLSSSGSTPSDGTILHVLPMGLVVVVVVEERTGGRCQAYNNPLMKGSTGNNYESYSSTSEEGRETRIPGPGRR